jgi:phosphate acetyltransferase
MTGSVYIAATEARSGKSAIALGVMEMLQRHIKSVGFFRPIIHEGKALDTRDNDIRLISSHFDLKVPYERLYGVTTAEAREMLSKNQVDAIIEAILRKYNTLKQDYDFMLCEGTDFESSTTAFELDINAEISKHLGSTVLLVANARNKTLEQTVQSIKLALDSLDAKGCQTIAAMVNRIDPRDRKKLIEILKKEDLAKKQLIYIIPISSGCLAVKN